jgi:hypothetical protein
MHVVCTLAEGRYFYGVAALSNSLVKAGFKGTIVVGYRGGLPHWLEAFDRDPRTDTYEISDHVRLHFVEVVGSWHLNNCKPEFMKRILVEIYNAAELLFYLDSDIVVEHAWELIADWAFGGVLVVLDAADSYMSPSHVYRRAWKKLAAKQNLECRNFWGYVNGGCVGVARAYENFVYVWGALMNELERNGTDMKRMKNFDGLLEFSRMDQDVLNATIMATDVPVSLLGSEAMGMFPWIGSVFPHAMWGRKPWDRNYILDALRGFPPGRPHVAYWKHVDGPVRPFTSGALLWKRTQLAIGKMIGQLHTRSFRDI